MINNLQLYRTAVNNWLGQDQIETEKQFKQLVQHLCDLKLLHPQEVKKLTVSIHQEGSLKFPITTQQLQQLIMNKFADPTLQAVIHNLDDLKIKIRQVKGIIGLWRQKGMSISQQKQLQSLFQEGSQKLNEYFELMMKQKQQIEGISEQQQQMIESLCEWVNVQGIKTEFNNYTQYQEHYNDLILQIYNKYRVKQVHFPQKKNMNKIQSIERVIGMNSKNDEPIQVILIPKQNVQFQKINQQLITFNALKDLTLSQYFPRFLGSNNHIDPNCFFYFQQLYQGVNLHKFIYKTKIQLEQETPIFKYFSCQIYYAFKDIYQTCSYLPKLPIKLEDIEICQNGLKMILKKIKFNEDRQQKQTQFYQTELLENVGCLILNLLKINKQTWNGTSKLNKIQNRSVVSCLINAKKGLIDYKQDRVKNHITFFNLQTHPLFQSKILLMGQSIIDNYLLINQNLI